MAAWRGRGEQRGTVLIRVYAEDSTKLKGMRKSLRPYGPAESVADVLERILKAVPKTKE